ncbi:flippase [Ancylobacter sp. MQZ15Z-1]|uniref:Flippase n=1 Tax=Ancylobacter mangrovi TaxID=2972472 RepID=A0A9X2T3A9_9HYPH|nr:flippase [Ancylobacter mangrovi]
MRGFFGTAGLRGASMVLSFGATTLLARHFGPTDFGVYSLALATATLLSVPTDLGLTRLVVREVSRYHVRENWGLMRGLISRSNQIVIAASGACCIGLIAWLFLRRDQGNHEIDLAFAIAFLLIPLVTLGRLRDAVLRGLDHIFQGQIPETLIRPAFFVTMIGGVLIFGDLRPWSALALNVLSAIVALAAGSWMLLRQLPQELRNVRPAYEMAAWLRALLPLSLIGGLDAVNNQADLIVIGIYRSAGDVGTYRSASLISMQIGIILTLMNVVLAPAISRMYHSNAHDELRRLARRSMIFVAGSSLPLVLICIFYGRALLSIIFGSPYVSAYMVLVALALGQMVNVLVGSVGLILNMTGHEKDVAIAGAVAAVGNLALNFVLVPSFGIEGAAWATASSLVVANVMMFWAVKRRLNIIMLPWPTKS